MASDLLISLCILLACASVCTHNQESNPLNVPCGNPRIQNLHKITPITDFLYTHSQHEISQEICSNMFHTTDFLLLSSNLKRFPKQNLNRNHPTTLLYLCILLLSRSSGIESNPGPALKMTLSLNIPADTVT